MSVTLSTDHLIVRGEIYRKKAIRTKAITPRIPPTIKHTQPKMYQIMCKIFVIQSGPESIIIKRSKPTPMTTITPMTSNATDN